MRESAPRPACAVSYRENDRGTTLILAMVFLLAVGLVIIATSTFAVGANINTVNAKAQQVAIANAEAEASAAIQSVRSAFLYPGSGCAPGSCTDMYSGTKSYPCTSPSTVVPGLQVDCVGFGGSANGQGTRTVDFYVCKTGPGDCSTVTGTQVALFAEVQYLDLPLGEDVSANQCTPLSQVTCGLTISFTSWDVRLADN